MYCYQVVFLQAQPGNLSLTRLLPVNPVRGFVKKSTNSKAQPLEQVSSNAVLKATPAILSDIPNQSNDFRLSMIKKDRQISQLLLANKRLKK